MKLYECEGKKLFIQYGIPVPAGILCDTASRTKKIPFAFPRVLKAQMLFGDRMKRGGIVFVKNEREYRARLTSLLGGTVTRVPVERVLVEEALPVAAEYYISLSYDTDTRGPMLAVSIKGGSGVKRAHLSSVDAVIGMPGFSVRSALLQAGFPRGDVPAITEIIQALWNCFLAEYALLLEINPLIKTKDGRFVAGDAKVILDDAKVNPGERRFIEMKGDIAILASGGGASLVNIDTLLHFGGRPANYTEYSGNPPAHVVKELTKKVLERSNLKGCWVVGGTANFTDIFETMNGFIEGLREVRPKPTYPIVIRRDGPRQDEAFRMLTDVARKEGYDFHLCGRETSMSESAKKMVELAYGNRTKRV